MAISDTLSNAVDELNYYMSAQPTAYKNYITKIKAAIEVMDNLRRDLDSFDPMGVTTSVRESLDYDLNKGLTK